MIYLHNLIKCFDEHIALNGISLHVPKGEIFAYLGPNGSGKTTTIRILTGLTQATAGQVTINGLDIAQEPMRVKRLIGLVSQTINLDYDLTVLENLDIHSRLFSMHKRQRQKRIAAVLKLMDLVKWTKYKVKALSGGLKRRITIARALLHEPQILFLDEPTVGLDPIIRRQLWASIKKIQQMGATIFLTTHYIEEAEFLANRVAFLNQGRIITINTPAKLISSLGKWAIQDATQSELNISFHHTRNAAIKAITRTHSNYIIRQINLEDAFIYHTNKQTAT